MARAPACLPHPVPSFHGQVHAPGGWWVGSWPDDRWSKAGGLWDWAPWHHKHQLTPIPAFGEQLSSQLGVGRVRQNEMQENLKKKL